MQLALYVGVLVYMYLSPSVAAQIGIEQVGTASSLIIVLLTLMAFKTYDINKIIARFEAEFSIIKLAIFIMVLKYIMQDIDGIRGAIFFLIVPTFVSILLGLQGVEVRKKLIKIILFFFITECFLAIYERVTLSTIFSYEELYDYITIEDLGFRSSAFLGHPLNNALCVSIIMGFIMISKMNLTHRMLFLLFGYISLLCFNARGATLVWTILLFIFQLKLIFSKNKEDMFSFSLLVIYIVSAFSIFQLVVVQNFGDRLFMGEELMDGSALTRVEIFDAFSYMNTVDFILCSQDNLKKLLTTGSVGGYENSFIVIITNYGIFMSLFIFLCFYLWIKQLLNSYSSYEKLITVVSFVFVGSMNNGLAIPTPWVFFSICAIAFKLGESFKNISNKQNQCYQDLMYK